VLNRAGRWNILLLGSGGREHALAWKIAASPAHDETSGARRAMPALRAKPSVCRSTSPTTRAWSPSARRTASTSSWLDPDNPLVAGIVDDIEAAGFRTFGPTKAAARPRRLQELHQGVCKAHNIQLPGPGFRRRHIRVNAIEPGAVITDRQRELWYKTLESIDAMIERQAIRKILLGEEIARTALFLAADDSRMITKQSITVDAGLR